MNQIKSEGRIQAECFLWYRKNINELSGRLVKFLLYKIHNEGKKTRMQASIDKAMGIVAGYPDMCLCVPSGSYAALYIEFKKNEHEEPGDKQLFIHSELRSVGNKVVVVWTFDQFLKEICEYLGIDYERYKIHLGLFK